jgi:starch synthase (maltosyl-transferring)
MAMVVNDRWQASFVPGKVGPHEIAIEAWTDRFATLRHDIEAKRGAGQDLETELEEGARLLEALAPKVAKKHRERLADAATAMRRQDCAIDVRLTSGLDDAIGQILQGVPDPWDLTRSSVVALWVDRERARVGAWYELFPRSEGGFEGAMKRLPAVADMGFDIVYLPPIHPIGHSHRKGRNNTLVAGPEDPGSPWAIGGEEGGHTEVNPGLGTIEDFDRFVAEADAQGLEVALDYALQCSPDHPWVRDHPEWFHHRPDGSIKYAENPPKKYQDIYPINFWPAEEHDRQALWEACKGILDHWISHGVKVFRVDNPHTKPMAFWEWLIPAVQADHPDTVYLAEAFTRPKVMAKLAEIGFTQSYTYFTWRTERWELEEYLTEIALGPKAEFMRPNFWPNTPDILAGPLRNGPPAAFMLRFVLAATMTPSYGMYSGYELCENQPMSETNEEYFESEKYEIKRREWDQPGSLAPFISRVNDIRRRHPALEFLRNVRFHYADNQQIICYSKASDDGRDVVLVVVNLDPWNTQEATLSLDLSVLGVDGSFQVLDELGGESYTWHGPNPYVRLDPAMPAHILHLLPQRV